MGPLIYSLCHKPALAVAMAAATLCDFPPLIRDARLNVDVAGSAVTADVEVPVDLRYALQLELSNPAGAALSKQEISILGDRRVEDCGANIDLAKVPRQQRTSFGRPMPFKVEVRRKPDNMLVHSRLVNTLCVASKWANQRSRSLGHLTLVRGSYSVRIENVAAQAGLEHLQATVLLEPHGARPVTAQR